MSEAGRKKKAFNVYIANTLSSARREKNAEMDVAFQKEKKNALKIYTDIKNDDMSTRVFAPANLFLADGCYSESRLNVKGKIDPFFAATRRRILSNELNSNDLSLSLSLVRGYRIGTAIVYHNH